MHDEVPEFVSCVEAAAGLVLLGRIEQDKRAVTVLVGEGVDPTNVAVELDDRNSVGFQQPHHVRDRTGGDVQVITRLLG